MAAIYDSDFIRMYTLGQEQKCVEQAGCGFCSVLSSWSMSYDSCLGGGGEAVGRGEFHHVVYTLCEQAFLLGYGGLPLHS